MNLTMVFSLAIGLAMDAFAVSVANALCYRSFGRREALLCGGAFGLFQAAMPLLGYLSGSLFSEAMESIDHWVALILLGIIGGKMIVEAIKEMRCGCEDLPDKRFTMGTLFVQAVATSIDAFAIGIGFSVLKVSIGLACTCIGVITFLLCPIGCYLGRRFGLKLSQKAQLLGGILLLLIGVRIFLSHVL